MAPRYDSDEDEEEDQEGFPQQQDSEGEEEEEGGWGGDNGGNDVEEEEDAYDAGLQTKKKVRYEEEEEEGGEDRPTYEDGSDDEDLTHLVADGNAQDIANERLDKKIREKAEREEVARLAGEDLDPEGTYVRLRAKARPRCEPAYDVSCAPCACLCVCSR